VLLRAERSEGAKPLGANVLKALFAAAGAFESPTRPMLPVCAGRQFLTSSGRWFLTRFGRSGAKRFGIPCSRCCDEPGVAFPAR